MLEIMKIEVFGALKKLFVVLVTIQIIYLKFYVISSIKLLKFLFIKLYNISVYKYKILFNMIS